MSFPRGICEDYYDVQKMRMELENQLRSFKQGASEQDAEVVKTTFADKLRLLEKDIQKYLQENIEQEPIYDTWLKNIKGIGPVLGAGLVSWIGRVEPHTITIYDKKTGKPLIDKKTKQPVTKEKGYATISKLWAYSGLKVDNDTGKAIKRKKGEKANYNARLKTLLWKVGESFVKGGDGYRTLYEQFRGDYDRKWKTHLDCGSSGCALVSKNRMKHSYACTSCGHKSDKQFSKKLAPIMDCPKCKKENTFVLICCDAHRYMAAKRKTVKVFLAHYWMVARQLKNLPIQQPWIIGRDGHAHEIPIVRR